MFDKALAFMHNGVKYVIVSGNTSLQEQFPDTNAVPIKDIMSSRGTMSMVAKPWGFRTPIDIPTISEEGITVTRDENGVFNVIGSVIFDGLEHPVLLTETSYDVETFTGSDEPEDEQLPLEDELFDEAGAVEQPEAGLMPREFFEEQNTTTDESEVNKKQAASELYDDVIKQEIDFAELPADTEVAKAMAPTESELNDIVDSLKKSQDTEVVGETVSAEQTKEMLDIMTTAVSMETVHTHTEEEPNPYSEIVGELPGDMRTKAKIGTFALAAKNASHHADVQTITDTFAGVVGKASAPPIGRGLSTELRRNLSSDKKISIAFVRNDRPNKATLAEMLDHCAGDALSSLPTLDGVTNVKQSEKGEEQVTDIADRQVLLEPRTKDVPEEDTSLKENYRLEEDDYEQEDTQIPVISEEPEPVEEVHSMTGSEILAKNGIGTGNIGASEESEESTESFLDKVSEDVIDALKVIPLAAMATTLTAYTTKLVDVDELIRHREVYCINNKWDIVGDWYCVDVLPHMSRYFYNPKEGISVEIPLHIYKQWRKLKSEEGADE